MTQTTEICLLTPAEPCTLSSATTAYDTGQIVLASDLNHRQLAALNEARNSEGTLILHLYVWGLVDGKKGIDRFYGHDLITVSSEHWQRVLRECEFAETLLIEVAAPWSDLLPELAAAVKALEDARRKLLLTRSPTEAAGECRHALDTIKTNPPLPAGVSLSCANGRKVDDLSLSERIAILKYALRLATQVPHHDKLAEVSMDTGTLIVQLTAVLLAHEMKTRCKQST